MERTSAEWRARLAPAILGVSVAACAGPEVTVPVYVSPNAYVSYDCDQILDRLEAVEAQYRPGPRTTRVQVVAPDAEPQAVVRQSGLKAELDALREAALERKCERPGRPLLVRDAEP